MARTFGLVPVIPVSPLNLSMVGSSSSGVVAAVLQTYSVWTLLGPVSVTEDSARVVAVASGGDLTMETT